MEVGEVAESARPGFTAMNAFDLYLQQKRVFPSWTSWVLRAGLGKLATFR